MNSENTIDLGPFLVIFCAIGYTVLTHHDFETGLQPTAIMASAPISIPHGKNPNITPNYMKGASVYRRQKSQSSVRVKAVATANMPDWFNRMSPEGQADAYIANALYIDESVLGREDAESTIESAVKFYTRKLCTHKEFTEDQIRAQVTGKFYEQSGEIAANKQLHVAIE